MYKIDRRGGSKNRILGQTRNIKGLHHQVAKILGLENLSL